MMGTIRTKRGVRRAATLASLVALAAFSIGCMGVASPVVGAGYADVRGPLGVGTGGAATKSGRACATTLLTLFATGDASIEAAMRAGSIRSVSTVDHESRNVLGLWGEFCTVVRGS